MSFGGRPADCQGIVLDSSKSLRLKSLTTGEAFNGGWEFTANLNGSDNFNPYMNVASLRTNYAKFVYEALMYANLNTGEEYPWLAESYEVNDDNSLVVGFDYGKYSETVSDVDWEQTTMPGFYVGLEHDINDWLTAPITSPTIMATPNAAIIASPERIGMFACSRAVSIIRELPLLSAIVSAFAAALRRNRNRPKRPDAFWSFCT